MDLQSIWQTHLLEPWTLIALVPIGLFIGMLSGLFGVGGGFLLVPVLRVFFGIPYELAVGSVLMQSAITSSFGTRHHIRLGHVHLTLGGLLITGTLFGAEAGVRLQQYLRALPDLVIGGTVVSSFEVVMSVLYIIVLGVIGTSILLETFRTRKEQQQAEQKQEAKKQQPAEPKAWAAQKELGQVREYAQTQQLAAGQGAVEGGLDGAFDAGAAVEDEDRWEPKQTALQVKLREIRVPPYIAVTQNEGDNISIWAPLLTGFCVSMLTGVMGIGGGIINMPLLVYVMGLPTVMAVGTASLQTFFSTAYGGIRYFLIGDVWLPIVGALLVGSLIGVRLGVRLSQKVRQDRLRRAFAVLILGTALLVMADSLAQL